MTVNVHCVLPKLRKSWAIKPGGAHACTKGERGASEQSVKMDTALSVILSSTEAACPLAASAKMRAKLSKAKGSGPADQMKLTLRSARAYRWMEFSALQQRCQAKNGVMNAVLGNVVADASNVLRSCRRK